ncbi:MAG: ABC transporter permease [Bacteroidota bacterium]
MSPIEAFNAALSSLRANKLRTFLTLLGMIIGVFAIITSVTAVKVIDVYFKERMSMLGTNTFTISRDPAVQINGNRIRGRRNLTYDQILRLKQSMTEPVAISIQEVFARGAARYGNRETDPNIMLIGTDEHLVQNYAYEVEVGRAFTEQDIHYGRPLMVLGSSVAAELFPNETPIGKPVTLGGRRYQVIGVLAAKGNFLGMNMDNRVFAPISNLFASYGGANRSLSAVSVRSLSMSRTGPAMEEVIGRMRTIRKVPPGEPNDFEVETNDSMRAVFDAFTGALTVGGAGIGLIALLAAGIGIMNIMLVSVTERTREIGIRKSIGARRRDILRQFLLEAFFLCQIGGAVGILLGIGAGNVTAAVFGITGAIPWGWAISAVVMVTVVALVFGGYPAARAARLDPIEALRYE